MTRIAPAPDAKTGLYRVDITPTSSKDLTYGQTWSISWEDADKDVTASGSSLILPLSAVTPRSEGVYEVWVLVSDRVSRREVTVGRVSSDRIEILKGLSIEDQVVAPKSEFYEGASVILP